MSFLGRAVVRRVVALLMNGARAILNRRHQEFPVPYTPRLVEAQSYEIALLVAARLIIAKGTFAYFRFPLTSDPDGRHMLLV